MAEPSTRLWLLAPHELTEQDMSWLLRACEAELSGIQPEHFIQMMLSGRGQIWRVEGKAQGIVVTKLEQHFNGKAMVLETLAGRGIFPGQARHLRDQLFAFGRAQGARTFHAMNVHRKLDKFYQRLVGVPFRAVEFVKELD